MLSVEPGATLAALLVAMALDRVLGEPEALYRRVPHPVVLAGRLVAWLEGCLLRPTEAPGRQRLAGLALVLVLVGAAVAIGLVLAAVCRMLPLGWLIEGTLMAALLAWKSLRQHVAAVASGLDESLARGRAAVAHIVGRDPESLDAPGVARAAVESLAENFSDGVVAPLFWGLVAGLPGMLAYKAVNTADSMIGHRDARHLHFGWAAARLDDLVNLAPARLSGLLIALSAGLTPRARPVAALRAMAHDAGRHRSPNAGWPEAAMAGALGLRLAGPRRYGGTLVSDAWMGEGRAEVTSADIRAALRLGGAAWRVSGVLLASGLALALGALG